LFIPTNEWQPIRKDQGIPRGLHVRLNVQTGEREAKLLDDNTEFIDGKIVKKQNILTRSQQKIKEALEQLNDEKSFNTDNQEKVYY
jgi:nucleotide exchange factor SIL1